MSVRRQLGITKTHRHLVLRRTSEQRHRRRARHLALKPGVDLDLVFHVPARKKSGERELRINDQVGPTRLGLVHQGEHPWDDDLPAIGPLDRTHLGRGNIDDSHGSAFSLSFHAAPTEDIANRRYMLSERLFRY